MQNTTAVLPASLPSSEFTGGKLLRIAFGTLLLTASSWVSIPMVPIPITMQTYAVIVIGALFGARLGVFTILAWLTEAAVGLPVLAQGASGIAVLLGPSAGYLFSFPVIAAVVGWLSDRGYDRGIVRSFLSMFAANTINLALGVLWLSTIIGWHRAVLSGFLPFWTGGIVKAILATATLQLIRKRRWKLAPYAR